MDKQIEAMRKMGMTEQEIAELIAFDKQVDKMKDSEVNADLSAEQKQVVKQARQADRTPTAYKFTKRERKADNEKAEIIEKIAEIFGNSAEIVNKEREIALKINGNDYSITLTKHRATKK